MSAMTVVNEQLALVLPGSVGRTFYEVPPDITFDQWVEVGRTLASMERSVMWWMGDWWRFGDQRYGERAAQALDSRYSFQTWRDAGWVSAAIETSRRRDALSFSHHKEVAALTPSEQDEWLDAAEVNAWTRNELRAAIRSAKRPTFDPVSALSGQYPVLYVDPPWRYEHVVTESRAIENQYPTMDLEDIKALQPPAGDDSVLFLWATSPKLAEALEVMEAWSFDYRTCMVWVKDQIGMGYYARQQHELLLIGRRGELPVPEPANRPKSVLVSPRGEHSVKPPEFYEVIESMYPEYRGAWCEMFARQQRDGWVAWGNQV